MTHSRAWLPIAAVAMMTVISSGPAAGQRPGRGPVDASQVLAAIDRGVAYLKREQNPRGNWSEQVAFPGGVTALATLALLEAGVEPSDPVVQRALNYLRPMKLEKTYTVALQTMALCAAEPKRDMIQITSNVRWLEDKQIKDGPMRGAWAYPDGGGDNSNSQFAVLALWEAQLVGAPVKRETWQRTYDYWARTQNADGSWGYVPGDSGSGAMTTAGIGGLATAAAALASGDAAVEGHQIICCLPHEDDDSLQRAIDWLGRRFSVSRNPRPEGSGQPCLYYYLYGVERSGRLTARRFIGDHDWYREGAEFLVHEQDPLSHYWQGTWHSERDPRISTSMALLFLAKGRRPIVMGKLQYGEDHQWNQHRRDAAHLTSYTEEAWDVGLTWQTLDPAAADVEDLLQAPVLYLSGSDRPDLAGQAEKLRDYVDRGGFIFAEACCRESSQFDAGFRELMADVFPEEEYELRQLDPVHPIWRMEEMVRPESPYVGRLWGIEYGCRTSVIYVDRDLSCYWELAQPGVWKRHPGEVTEQISDALAIGLNVLTYATNREPKGKEHSFVSPLEDMDMDSSIRRGVVEIAKIRHGGGCNDAPGALVNLVRTASQGEAKLRARPAEEMIALSDDRLFGYHLVFMHGRHDFRLTPAEREQLAEYLQRGGTLLVDSICASRPFTQAVRREIGEALAGHTFQRIPPDDRLFTPSYGGYDIRQVTLRDPLVADGNQPVAARLRDVEPQLEGIQIDGRWAVIFSPFDISCALESAEAVGCRGYTREDAARIGLNVLLYSLNQ